MDNMFQRTALLIGENNLQKLRNSHVAIFGIGGVGGFTLEALVRSGIGKITIIDSDCVEQTNLNRQIISNRQVVGQSKVEVAKNRALSINPRVEIVAIKMKYLKENANEIDISKFDYIVDAIDTVSSKIHLIQQAKEHGVRIISCMGTGGKLDTRKLCVSTIDKTNGCPLARVMRRELRKIGISDTKVVYSTEQSMIDAQQELISQKMPNGRSVTPSMIFVPATAGLMLAQEVVLDIIKG